MKATTKDKQSNYNRVYVDDILPKDIKSQLHKLSDKLRTTKKYIEFTTNCGIINLEDGHLKLLKINDAPIERKNRFIIDKSTITKERILSQIPYDNSVEQVVANYYGNSINVQLVVEGNIKSSGFVPINFYFLVNDSFDLDNEIIAEEIEWFLSVLK
uniref:Uncharacterized protein n=1 Tax=viral metagenome TaxID=1070528 RepID=A0A6C0KUG8_9ZZZZ